MSRLENSSPFSPSNSRNSLTFLLLNWQFYELFSVKSLRYVPQGEVHSPDYLEDIWRSWKEHHNEAGICRRYPWSSYGCMDLTNHCVFGLTIKSFALCMVTSHVLLDHWSSCCSNWISRPVQGPVLATLCRRDKLLPAIFNTDWRKQRRLWTVTPFTRSILPSCCHCIHQPYSASPYDAYNFNT